MDEYIDVFESCFQGRKIVVIDLEDSCILDKRSVRLGTNESDRFMTQTAEVFDQA